MCGYVRQGGLFIDEVTDKVHIYCWAVTNAQLKTVFLSDLLRV